MFNQTNSTGSGTSFSGSTGNYVVGKKPFAPSILSEWPEHKVYSSQFCLDLRRIIQETMLDELRRVLGNESVEGRGHVVGVAYMCALESIARYGYDKKRCVQKFVQNHFPAPYPNFASRFYPDYRIPLAHQWNLSGPVRLVPTNRPPGEDNGVLTVGLPNFADAFEIAVKAFFAEIEAKVALGEKARQRYEKVRTNTAK